MRMLPTTRTTASRASRINMAMRVFKLILQCYLYSSIQLPDLSVAKHGFGPSLIRAVCEDADDSAFIVTIGGLVHILLIYIKVKSVPTGNNGKQVGLVQAAMDSRRGTTDQRREIIVSLLIDGHFIRQVRTIGTDFKVVSCVVVVGIRKAIHNASKHTRNDLDLRLEGKVTEVGRRCVTGFKIAHRSARVISTIDIRACTGRASKVTPPIVIRTLQRIIQVRRAIGRLHVDVL